MDRETNLNKLKVQALIKNCEYLTTKLVELSQDIDNDDFDEDYAAFLLSQHISLLNFLASEMGLKRSNSSEDER